MAWLAVEVSSLMADKLVAPPLEDVVKVIWRFPVPPVPDQVPCEATYAAEVAAIPWVV